MKEEAIECKKMYRLARLLRVEHAHAVGLMEMFWRGVRQDAPDGSLRGIDAVEIAIWCKWQGDSEALLSALASAKWVDASARHQWLVHDWPQHCENSVHTRMAKERRWFADGTAPDPAKFKSSIHSAERAVIEEFYKSNRPPWQDSGGEGVCHGEFWRGADPPQISATPNRTEPNLTIPNHTVPSSNETESTPETAERAGEERRRTGPKKVSNGFETAGALLRDAVAVEWLRGLLWRHSRFPEAPDRELVSGLLRDAGAQAPEWWETLLARLEQAHQRPGKTYGWYVAVVQRAAREGRGAA